jgi:hypothetical protein
VKCLPHGNVGGGNYGRSVLGTDYLGDNPAMRGKMVKNKSEQRDERQQGMGTRRITRWIMVALMSQLSQKILQHRVMTEL